MVTSPLLLLLLVTLGSLVHAKTKEQYIADMMKAYETCGKELKIKQDELMIATKNMTSFANLPKPMKCMLSCLDDKIFTPGGYDEKRYADIEQYIRDIMVTKPDKLQDAMKVHALCKKFFINKDPCEDAALTFLCYQEEAKKMGISQFLDLE